MTSPDMTEANIDRLAELFPNVITETLDAAAELDAAGIPNGLMNDMAAVIRHPQLVERHRWTSVGSPVGEIDAVGEGVDPSRIGQRVWTWLASPGGDGGAALAEWGTCAQYTVLPAEQATVLPDGAPDDLGACLGVPAMTAYHCLFADGPVTGRTVLVTGGAGAVGHYGIQLARWAGATVVTTVSGPEKAELARAAGAHHVVNYRDGDPGAAILDAAGPVDRIVEVSLAHNLAQDLAVLRNGGAVVSYAATPQDPSIPVRALMGANAVLRFALLYTVPRPVLADAAHGLGVAAAHGALTPLPVTRFGIDDVVAAHEAVEAGTTGKVVVDL